MKISINNILKIKRYKYFNDTYIDNIIRRRLQILMLYAFYYKSCESLMLLNIEDFSYSITSDRSSSDVNFSEKMLIDLAKNNRYMAIHNHITVTTFSLKDIITFISVINIHYIVVITNDCKHVAIARKIKEINGRLKFKLINGINNYITKYRLDEHSSGLEIIKFLCMKGYIEYIEKY